MHRCLVLPRDEEKVSPSLSRHVGFMARNGGRLPLEMG